MIHSQQSEEEPIVHTVCDSTASTLHTPLDESRREIRLLRMHDDVQRGIELDLNVVSLDDRPVFRALSYLWTSAAAECTISVNGMPFQVRPNLYAYLEVMHEEGHSDTIFIDAICINQSDLAERASQVSLMGSLYREAELVIVWLGVMPIEYQTILDDVPGPRSKVVDIVFSLEHDDPERTRPLLALLFSFAMCEYWTRVWIVQEVLLARKLVFRCGSFQASADALFDIIREDIEGSSLAESLHHVGPDATGFLRPQLLPEEDRDSELWQLLRAYFILHQRHEDWSSRGTPRARELADVLSTHSAQTCSVDYDKIYGFLGLTDSICKVDYKIPKLELYLRVLIEGRLQLSSLRPDVIEPDVILGVALLTALNLRIETLVVWRVTVLALSLCGASSPKIDRFVKGALLERTYKGRTTLRGRLENMWANILLQTTNFRLAFYNVVGSAKLPAVDSHGGKTLDIWEQIVHFIFDDVQTRFQRHQAEQHPTV